MNPELDLAILLLSAVLFGVFSGACSALEILAYGHSERNEEEHAEKATFAGRLLEKAVENYLSVSLGRTLFFAAVVVVTYKLLAGALPLLGVLAVMAAVLLIPLFAAKLLAVRSPAAFLAHTRAATYPGIYLLRPIIMFGILILRRHSPDLLDSLAFAVLPFKKRVELYGHRNGAEEMDERQLMSSVFDFGDTRVREVMIPRIDMVAVDIHTPAPEAVDTIVDAGHSRVPVYDETIDRIVGIVHAKEILQRMVSGGNFSLRDVARDVYFVPESKMIDELLSEFKKRRCHIAIAVDEYGGTAGLVTLEDVLEELVGDIQDEFDTEEELINISDADSVICNARVRLDELRDATGLDLAEGEGDTLGGFLYELIGRVPRVGEVFTHGGLQFEILSVVRQRIDKVHIKGLSSIPGRPDDAVG